MVLAARKPWTPLRTAAVTAGVLGTLFWIGCIVRWWRIPDNARDGFEYFAVLLAHAFFMVAVLPTLVLGLLGRWLVFAAILAFIVLALDSDVLLPWIPWEAMPWNWF